MIPINIYNLTRIKKISLLTKIERQMSKRRGLLKIKSWEIDSLKKLSEHLKEEMDNGTGVLFYYSFQIPKLGKEFDLLRISDEYVLNIELKSMEVPEDKIKNQLLQNRYYLALLGKPVRSYTYVSDTDKLYRLSNTEKVIESDWGRLGEDILKQTGCYEEDIDKLFKEEQYLISPLTNPKRFLERDYFLTSQQKDIRKHILANIQQNNTLFQGFTGLPGTGKTLLLYDLALVLSEKQKVIILHNGTNKDELSQFNRRFKRMDFYNVSSIHKDVALSDYSAILVDESHQISKRDFDRIKNDALEYNIPVIFTYDVEDAIYLEDVEDYCVGNIRKLPEYNEYRLTNRIRMNKELSSFILSLMNISIYHHRKDYPSVSLAYASSLSEAKEEIRNYMLRGYVYIRIDGGNEPDNNPDIIKAGLGIGREFDKVVMVIDSEYYYDNKGYLRCYPDKNQVRILYHGLNRAKKEIAVVVLDNEVIFEKIVNVFCK